MASKEEYEHEHLLDEATQQTYEVESLQRQLRRLKILVVALVATLLISNIGIAFFLNHAPLQTNRKIPITFLEDHAFSGPSNATTDAAWGSITPPGDGFISLPDPRNESDPLLRDVSMYHQLHCLRHIRTYLWTMRFAVEFGTYETTMKTMDPKLEHVGHCFDYLRQGILCAGDLALETPRESDGGVDGWGAVHECVDPKVIEEFMEERRLEVYQ